MGNFTDADKVLRNDTGKDIVAKLNEVATAISGGSSGLAATVIADEYDNTSTYSIGDYVIYNSVLYECISDITVAEDFDNDHWSAIKVVDIIPSVDSTLQNKTLTQVGEAVSETQTFANLITTDKTIVGSINEVGTIPDTASGVIASFFTSVAKPLVDCTTEASATKVIQTSGSADIAACIRGLFLGTHKFIKLGDLSSSSWNYDSTNLRFYHAVSDAKANTAQRAYTSGCVLSNSYEPAFTTGEVVYATMISEIANMDNIYWLYTFQNGNQSIQFKDTDYTTIESFVNSVKDVYWIYELETPVTPTITSEEFTTLCTAFGIQGLITDLPLTDNPTNYAGSNNFFTDSGNISVTYLETIKEYIDKRVNSNDNSV